MNRPTGQILASVLTAVSISAALILCSSSAPAQSAPPPPEPTPSPRPLPPNQPARGIIYDGLEYGDSRACNGLFRTKDHNNCTHGPDPSPLNIDVRTAPPPLAPRSPSVASAIQCDGDGTSGYRTQVMYVRGSDKTDRFDTFLSSFKQWAIDADTIYADSAAETGGYRLLRFVHDASCSLVVLDVGLSQTGHIDFNTMESALAALGFNRSDRKYMIFMDDNLYCGIGSLYGDDTPGASNLNNSQKYGPAYARADNGGCWSGSVIAHESMHNMGAVQHSAPHSTYLQNQSSGNTWHCSDEWDRMCYSDAAAVTMTYPCGGSSNSVHDRLFDCNHDDYYHTNPSPGSYLATHWNSANNQFLIKVPAVPLNLVPRAFLPLVLR